MLLKICFYNYLREKYFEERSLRKGLNRNIANLTNFMPILKELNIGITLYNLLVFSQLSYFLSPSEEDIQKWLAFVGILLKSKPQQNHLSVCSQNMKILEAQLRQLIQIALIFDYFIGYQLSIKQYKLSQILLFALLAIYNPFLYIFLFSLATVAAIEVFLVNFESKLEHSFQSGRS